MSFPDMDKGAGRKACLVRSSFSGFGHMVSFSNCLFEKENNNVTPQCAKNNQKSLCKNGDKSDSDQKNQLRFDNIRITGYFNGYKKITGPERVSQIDGHPMMRIHVWNPSEKISPLKNSRNEAAA
jgi:hypothetical protein